MQVGQDIDGEAADDFSGSSVSLSSDGSVVAIGAKYNDGSNGDDSGHVRVYSLYDGIWVQVGQDIDGEAGDDFSGSSVSLNADGSVVAIGAYGNVSSIGDIGHVRIFEVLDSDGDGLHDFEELNVYGTDTNNIDTDGDGWNDYFEIHYVNSPTNSDFDVYMSSNSILSLNQELIDDYSNQVAVLTASNAVLSLALANMNYIDTDFTGESFSNSVFSGADFTGAIFSNSIFSEADFGGVVFSNSTFAGAVFNENVSWSNTVFNRAKIVGAIFSNQTEIASYFTNSAIVASDLDAMLFYGNDIEGYYILNNIDAEFMSGDFTGSTFHEDITWSNAVFNRAKIVGATFSNETEIIASYFTNSAITANDLDNTLFYANDIEGQFQLNNIDAEFMSGDFTGSTFHEDITWSNAVFNRAKIVGATFSNETEIIASYFTNSAITANDLDNTLFYANDIEGQFQLNNIDAEFMSGDFTGSTFYADIDLNDAIFENGMLTSNQANAMLDAAYSDDMIISVSNNTVSIIQVIEQSSNLSVGAWSDVQHVTNSIPVDADAAFFRFRLTE